MTLQVEELWRYPVKSLRGERLEVADVGWDGVAGDRLAHVRQQSGRVVTSRFRPRLLGLQGSLGQDGEPLVAGLPWTRPVRASSCALPPGPVSSSCASRAVTAASATTCFR